MNAFDASRLTIGELLPFCMFLFFDLLMSYIIKHCYRALWLSIQVERLSPFSIHFLTYSPYLYSGSIVTFSLLPSNMSDRDMIPQRFSMYSHQVYPIAMLSFLRFLSTLSESLMASFRFLPYSYHVHPGILIHFPPSLPRRVASTYLALFLHSTNIVTSRKLLYTSITSIKDKQTFGHHVLFLY